MISVQIENVLLLQLMLTAPFAEHLLCEYLSFMQK